jgi:hypothetical protein
MQARGAFIDAREYPSNDRRLSEAVVLSVIEKKQILNDISKQRDTR